MNTKLIKILTVALFGLGIVYGSVDPNEKSSAILNADSLMKNVVKHSPRVSEQEINEAEITIVKSAHEEERQKADQIHFCMKNYNSPCPQHWRRVVEENKIFCIADSTYNGFCEVIQSFENFTEEEKINFESSCNVQWPCKNTEKELCPNGRDYSDACPEGFIEEEDHNCKVDIRMYSGMCKSEQINFTHMTDEEKEKWSIACDAYWPCLEECPENEPLSMCPKKWILINSFECEPTDKYFGPCKNKKSFKYFTREMKENFEEKCKTRFSCEHSCEKNYSIACPREWTEEKGVCVAPSSFDLCSRKKLSIENLTKEDKQNFEKECSVQWPCKEESMSCDMNWNMECPLDWDIKKEGDKIICEKDKSLEGNCSRIVLPKEASEEMKREFASTCNVPWPCRDETLNYIFPSETTLKNNMERNSGPITNEGKIFRKNKYSVREENNTQEYNIMK